MKIRPIGNRIVVSRSEAEEKSPGGIIIPDAHKKKSARGTVRAVGPGRRLDDGTVQPCDVREGDEIVFDKHAGSDLEIDGEKVTIVQEDDVIGVVSG